MARGAIRQSAGSCFINQPNQFSLRGLHLLRWEIGGAVLEAVLKRINLHARIPLVGLISQYNDQKLEPGPNLGSLISNRALIQGMLVLDHTHRMPDFLRDMSQWLREGKVRYREDIIEGLENAPRAFIGLFEGENIGKRVVRVSADPTRKAKR